MNAAPGHSAAPVAGVVLAGGRSARMGGGDKCLTKLGDAPILAHVIARLHPQVSAMALNANGDARRFARFGLPVIADPVPGFAGPLAGMLAAMEWAQAQAPEARFVVTVASDTPFFPLDLVERFIEAAGGDATVTIAASGGRRHPVFGLWPLALAGHLRAWLEGNRERKVRSWIGQHRIVEVPFADVAAGGVLHDPFFNANTPDDMRAAETILKETTT